MTAGRYKKRGPGRRKRVILSGVIFATGLWAYLKVVDIQPADSAGRLAANTASHYFWPHSLDQYPRGIATRGELSLPTSR